MAASQPRAVPRNRCIARCRTGSTTATVFTFSGSAARRCRGSLRRPEAVRRARDHGAEKLSGRPTCNVRSRCRPSPSGKELESQLTGAQTSPMSAPHTHIQTTTLQLIAATVHAAIKERDVGQKKTAIQTAMHAGNLCGSHRDFGNIGVALERARGSRAVEAGCRIAGGPTGAGVRLPRFVRLTHPHGGRHRLALGIQRRRLRRGDSVHGWGGDHHRGSAR